MSAEGETKQPQTDGEIDMVQLKAAEAWRSARWMPEIQNAREVAKRGGTASSAQLRDVWVSGFMNGALELLHFLDTTLDEGGPNRALAIALSRAIDDGESEKARALAEGVLAIDGEGR